MTDPHPVRKTRAGSPALAVFSNGAALPRVKAEALRLLASLGAYASLDETALRAEQPGLLTRVQSFSPAGLDFFRALRDDQVTSGCFSRRNISACLRTKRNQFGRPLQAADFAPGHVVPLMALVYWGSVAAWVEHAPERAQRPRGFWLLRENQLSAIRALVAAHPEQPVTHRALHAAGYHALASNLSGAQLAALVAAAGLGRKLRMRESGHWTAERTIDAYAVLCRQHKVTLSSHALIRISDGCTLRVLARRHFGCFRAFRAAALLRHPDLRPAKQPTAADGSLLDSWQEVVVYNALRIALPAAEIAMHVLLSAGSKRSADFVVGGRVYVEVLGIAEAEMTAPRSGRQIKYARQWSVKRAIYRDRDLALVVVEPDDVHDPSRLAARIAEVAGLLGMTAQARPASVQPCTRPKGYWSFRTLCDAVGEVARAVGGFPTHAQLSRAGYVSAITRLKGGQVREQVAAAIGYPLRHERSVWSRERVLTELLQWGTSSGRYPTQDELKAAGKSALINAMQRLYKREAVALRTAVERGCGRPLPTRKAPGGSYDTMAQLAVLLRPLCEQLGRFPLKREMKAHHVATVATAVSRFGTRRMAAHMGYRHVGPKRLDKAESLDLFEAAPARVGEDEPGSSAAPASSAAAQAR